MFDLAHIIPSSKTNFRLLCGAIIPMNQNIVLVQEKARKVHGRWSIPAGQLEHGENIFEATKREVKEETNLDIQLKGLVGVYNWYSQEYKTGEIYCVFLANDIKGELQPNSDDILATKMFSFQEIVGMPEGSFAFPQCRQIIKDYRRGKLYPLEVMSVL